MHFALHARLLSGRTCDGWNAMIASLMHGCSNDGSANWRNAFVQYCFGALKITTTVWTKTYVPALFSLLGGETRVAIRGVVRGIRWQRPCRRGLYDEKHAFFAHESSPGPSTTSCCSDRVAVWATCGGLGPLRSVAVHRSDGALQRGVFDRRRPGTPRSNGVSVQRCDLNAHEHDVGHPKQRSRIRQASRRAFAIQYRCLGH